MEGPAVISFRFPGDRMGVFEAVHSRDLLVETRHYAQDDQVEITGTKASSGSPAATARSATGRPVILYADGETRGFSALPTGWEESFTGSTRQTIRAVLDGDAASPAGRESTCCASASRRSSRRPRGTV